MKREDPYSFFQSGRTVDLDLFSRTISQRSLVYIMILTTVLLFVRFSYTAMLASMRLSAAQLNLLDQVFSAYEIVLPFLLFGIITLLAQFPEIRSRRGLTISVLIFQLVNLIVWLYYMDPGSPGIVKSIFPLLATAAVAAGAFLSFRLSKTQNAPEDWTYLSLLFVVPIVFALRVGASLGLGTVIGPDGVARGNWMLVYLPTLLMELLAVVVWLNLVTGMRFRELRAHWHAFLPFVIIPLFLVAIRVSPLSGYIFSAFVTWGSNLALFVPVAISLGLAVTAVACFFSAFMLLRGRTRRSILYPVMLGWMAVILSGFYSSMASVEGLTFALFTLAPYYANRNLMQDTPGQKMVLLQKAD